MRIDLLGLDADTAQAMLVGEGFAPRVTVYSAPRRAEETRGTLRVVYASDDGARLTVARFLEPLSGSQRENGADGE